MLNKKLLIGMVVIIGLIGFGLAARSIFLSARPKKAAPQAKAKTDVNKMPVKKTIPKGKGLLTVKILNSKSVEIPLKIKIFRVADSRTSIYAASTVGGRAQDLPPGSYDIEIDTVPQKIFKNFKVSAGRETVKNLGCVTGSLIIKTVNIKKSPAYYPLRILNNKTNDMVTAFMTNKALDLVPGVYDVEIGTSPRMNKKNVKVEAGKEGIVDLGCLTGILVIRTTDSEKKDVRCSVKVSRSDTKEIVSSQASNKPIELSRGVYDIEVMASPKQTRQNVNVNAGEETGVDFTVAAPASAQKSASASPKEAAIKTQAAKTSSSPVKKNR